MVHWFLLPLIDNFEGRHVEKIINLIKDQAKANKKEISKNEAEKILKDTQNTANDKVPEDKKKNKPTSNPKSAAKKSFKSKSKVKKVSKK